VGIVAFARTETYQLLTLVLDNATMTFCDADACPTCPLNATRPCCLRHKAQFCMRLARRTSRGGFRTALEKMSSQLMAEAEALEREAIVRGLIN
jgi:hypothetical protein